MNQVCGCSGREKWTPQEVDDASRRDIQLCRANVVVCSGPIRNWIKWHIMDHVADDIVRNLGRFFFHERLYDFSHIIFKNSYQKTSKRRSTAMKRSYYISRT